MINIVICDDESSFAEIIEHKIKCSMQSMEFEFQITKTQNLDELNELAAAGLIDIAFIDVMINDVNSIDWTMKYLQNKNIQIVFMTGFPTESYNLSEIKHCYYIIKQRMTEEQILRALKRAIQNLSKKNPNLKVIEIGSKGFTVNCQDILYIETFSNNITIHMSDNTKIKVYSTLKSLMRELPPCFLRCHKCYAINMNHITSFEPHQFILFSGNKIPISPKKYNDIVTAYKNYLNYT